MSIHPADWPNYGAIEEDNEELLDEHVHEKCSNWAAYINLVCAVAGTGTLGIACAIRQGGWISVPILILFAVMATYANNKLIESLYYDGKSRKFSMPQLAYEAFGKFGLIFIGFFYNAIAIGCPVLYLILSGDNFQSLFNALEIDWGTKRWIYICSIVAYIPFVLTKTMKEAVWLGTFGALTTGFVVFIVFVMSLIELPGHPDSGHDMINFREIPLAMATFSFSYGGNVIYPNIEASMKTPAAWPKVNGWATFSVTLMYLIIGIPAYLVYGHATLSPIYLNLPTGWAVSISIIMITAHVLLAIPLFLTSLCLELENIFGISITNMGKSKEFLFRFILRTIVMIIVVEIAVTAPFFADVMSLLGSLGNGLLIVVMPTIIWIRLFGWNRLNGVREKVWVVFIIVLSSIGALIGSGEAIIALWADITKGEPFK